MRVLRSWETPVQQVERFFGTAAGQASKPQDLVLANLERQIRDAAAADALRGKNDVAQYSVRDSNLVAELPMSADDRLDDRARATSAIGSTRQRFGHRDTRLLIWSAICEYLGQTMAHVKK